MKLFLTFLLILGLHGCGESSNRLNGNDSKQPKSGNLDHAQEYAVRLCGTVLAKPGLHHDWYYAIKAESALVVLDLSDSLDQDTLSLFELLHNIENGVNGCVYGHALPRAVSTFERIPFDTNLFFDVEYAVLGIAPGGISTGNQ